VIILPALALAVACLVGGVLALFGAYRRGLADVVVVRLFDVLLAFPPLLLVLVLIAGLGQSSLVVAISVALVFLPRTGRVIRSAAQTVVTHDYVAAAQARGESTLSILTRELLPNIASPLIADVAMRLTHGIIIVSTLNYLGLGVNPPHPTWGLMVAESQSVLTVAPLGSLVPAAGIALLSVSTNLIADSITRHLTRNTTRGSGKAA
jgi:peptide/nickel transport system permease protein